MMLSLSVGCAHDKKPPPRGARTEAIHDSPPPAERGDDWTKLGERWVDGGNDRDVISVGGRDGEFRRIMIVVENSALEMHDIDVVFGDGSKFSPRTRHVFGPSTRSSVIDLPGTRRTIRTVAFRYGNLPGGGKAKAELWAE
jgi:hypothetical protein